YLNLCANPVLTFVRLLHLFTSAPASKQVLVELGGQPCLLTFSHRWYHVAWAPERAFPNGEIEDVYRHCRQRSSEYRSMLEPRWRPVQILFLQL
ncbi:hypothetical protein L9F63_022299, partial [Diploptera punctata]